MADPRFPDPAPPVALLLGGDRRRLEDLLENQVVFFSPYADYRGRADVAHMFHLISSVLEGAVATSTANDGERRYSGLSARVEGWPIEGVLIERHRANRRLIQATLYLRPYRTLGTAMASMGRLLQDEPLPSRRD